MLHQAAVTQPKAGLSCRLLLCRHHPWRQLQHELRSEIQASQSTLELNFKAGLTELQSQITNLFSKVIPSATCTPRLQGQSRMALPDG